MKIQKINLKDLTPNPKNIRMHSETQTKELRRSFEAFGQIRPIVVDEDNVIIAGHGLVEAMIEAGEETGDVLKMENLSKNEKLKLMIADNKIYELGVNDLDALNGLLLELKGDDDLSIPGFDDDVLDVIFGLEEEVDEELKDYGSVLDKEKVERMEEQRETKVQQVNEAPAGTEGNHIELQGDVIQVDNENPEEPKPYVECPKCGEKIWV